jgi:hypothetical protein
MKIPGWLPWFIWKRLQDRRHNNLRKTLSKDEQKILDDFGLLGLLRYKNLYDSCSLEKGCRK